MVERITLDDFAEHVGCRHVLEAQVVAVVRAWVTGNAPNTTTSRFAQLRNMLGTAIPTVTWTGAAGTRRVRRALRTAFEDQNEDE